MSLSQGDIEKISEVVRTVVREELDRPKKKDKIHLTEQQIWRERKFIEVWNKLPSEFIKLRDKNRLPKPLRSAFHARCRDDSWPADCYRVIEWLPSSPFHRGENSSGWKANPEWLFRPKSVMTAMSQMPQIDQEPDGWREIYNEMIADPNPNVEWCILTKNLRDKISMKLQQLRNV